MFNQSIMNQYANDFTRTTQTYFNELKKYKPLTKAKEKRLIKQVRKGNLKAKNELLEANLKFVFEIAKHYTGRGVSISDLISEGNMGLLRAVDKFDETQDIKFISYAVWWIRQAILASINKKKLINMVEIDSTESNDNIIEKTISDDEDEIVYRNDKFYSNEAEEHLVENGQAQKEVVAKLLNVLNAREKEILENYYGLNNCKELTLAEIGEKFNLSSERVRQINKKSLKKLRTKILLLNDFEDLLS